MAAVESSNVAPRYSPTVSPLCSTIAVRASSTAPINTASRSAGRSVTGVAGPSSADSFTLSTHLILPDRPAPSHTGRLHHAVIAMGENRFCDRIAA